MHATSKLAVQCERSKKIRTGGECDEGFVRRVRVLVAGDEDGGADEVLGERGGGEEEEGMVRMRGLGRGWMVRLPFHGQTCLRCGVLSCRAECRRCNCIQGDTDEAR